MYIETRSSTTLAPLGAQYSFEQLKNTLTYRQRPKALGGTLNVAAGKWRPRFPCEVPTFSSVAADRELWTFTTLIHMDPVLHCW